MIVVIGSRRHPKVKAVEAALQKLARPLGFEPENVIIKPLDVDSGISSMPMSLKELMRGAKTRAENAAREYLKRGKTFTFAIGMEGGLFSESPGDGKLHYFLQSWVYVLGRDRGAFGCSAAAPVPDAIVAEILNHGKELGEIIDKYGQDVNIRDKGGAFEVFTLGHMIRQRSYEDALMCAFAPFYNARMYK